MRRNGYARLAAVLAASMLLSMIPAVTFASDTPEYETISLQNGAQSLLFLNEGENVAEADFTVHKDFMGYQTATLTDEGIAAAKSNFSRAVRLSETTTGTNVVVSLTGGTDDEATDGFWNVTNTFEDGRTKTVPYYLHRDNKVVKLCGYNATSTITDADFLAWAGADKGAGRTTVCETTPNYYTTINLLTAYPDSTASDLEVTVFYSDGTSDVVTRTLNNNPYSGSDPANGYVVTRAAVAYDDATRQNGVRFSTVEIPVTATKQVCRLQFKAMSSTWRHTYIIAATGEKTSVSALIDLLPAAADITGENVLSAMERYNDVLRFMEDTGMGMQDLTAEERARMTAVKAAIDALYYTTERTIPLNIQNGANSLLCLDAGQNITEHIAYRDYLPKNYMPSGLNDSYNYIPTAIRVAESGTQNLDLLVTPGNIWNVKGVDYRVGTALRAVKLYKVGTITMSDAAAVAEIQKLNNISVDLESGLYKKLRILAANPHGNTGSAADRYASVSYVLTYTDGTEQTGTLEVDCNPFTNTYDPKDGYIRARSIYDVSDGTKTTACKFQGYEIETDETKMVDTIRFTLNSAGRNVVIAAISGDSASLGSIKEEIGSRLRTLSGSPSTASKDALFTVRDLLGEYEAVGGSAADIDGIEKYLDAYAVYQQKAIAVESASADTDFSHIYARVRFSQAVTAGSGAVRVMRGDAALADTAYTVEVEGNALTVILPNDGAYQETYTVSLNRGIVNASDASFYLDADYTFSFVPKAPVVIDGFAAGTEGVTATVKNNQLAAQPYSLLIAVYSESGKMIYKTTEHGTLAPQSDLPVSCSPDVNLLGCTVALYLADSFSELNYLALTPEIEVAEAAGDQTT